MTSSCEICRLSVPLYFHQVLIAALCQSCKANPAPWFVNLRKSESIVDRGKREALSRDFSLSSLGETK